ncbi:hypothetical protein ABZ468_51660 [Streptomyces sp. NPDC005708]|uniref:hypothetical protein n=1 Tax=Streptomyces sp. NPDC005708 TaxID=3154564 RepID=UPI0033DFE467
MRASRSIAGWAFSLPGAALLRRTRCNSSRPDLLNPPVSDASTLFPALAAQLPKALADPRIPRNLRDRRTCLGHSAGPRRRH